jgi:hypothetical protein
VHRDDLGIAEPVPMRTTPFIDDEYPVAVGHELDEIETRDVLAVRPATRKVGRAVNPVIKWAGKVEVSCDQSLNYLTTLGNIGFVCSAYDCDDIVCRSIFFLCHCCFGLV